VADEQLIAAVVANEDVDGGGKSQRQSGEGEFSVVAEMVKEEGEAAAAVTIPADVDEV
jgi:hypothetical protein